MIRPSIRIGSAIAGLAMLLATPGVLSYDASLPYRNYSSFHCFSFNTRGECTNFTYNINDRATSSSSNSSNYYYNNSSSSNTSTSGNGDIDISITPDGDAVRPGELVSFEIELRNTRRSRITTDVRATMDSSDMIFQSASGNGEKINSREVEWQNVSVNGSNTKLLRLSVRINTNATVGRGLHLTVETDDNDNVATIVTSNRSRTNSDNCDTYYSNDCEDLRSDGRQTVRITSSPDPFEPGQKVFYTIRIDNDESYNRDIDVRAILDRNATFVSASDNNDHAGKTVTWNNLRINGDQTRTLLLTVYTDRGINDGNEIELRVEVNGREEDTEQTEARFR